MLRDRRSKPVGVDNKGKLVVEIYVAHVEWHKVETLLTVIDLNSDTKTSGLSLMSVIIANLFQV